MGTGGGVVRDAQAWVGRVMFMVIVRIRVRFRVMIMVRVRVRVRVRASAVDTPVGVQRGL